MDSSSALKLEVKVTWPVFYGVLWAGTAIALSLVIFRLHVRIRAFKKLLTDDYLVILAMSFLLTTSIIWETQADILYDQYAIAAGTKQIYPEYFAKAEDFFHIPFTILFYTSLWSVKIEVLLFFKRIGYEIRLFKAWWWCVLGITVATYVVCIGDFQFQCILGSLTHILTYYGTLEAVHFENRILIINCVLDVLTDMCILSIPVFMLWNVRIPRRKKTILLEVFSLIIVVVVISIVRVRAVLGKDKDIIPDITWMHFWINLEMATCKKFPGHLYTLKHNERKTDRIPNPQNSYSSRRRRLVTFFKSHSGSRTVSSSQRTWPAKRLGEDPPVFPLERIHVEYNHEITDSPTREDRENPNSSYYVFPPPKVSSKAV